MNRATRRRFQRDFAKMPKEDNCSLCGNPIQIIESIYKDKPNDIAYAALRGRLVQVGADDIDLI